MAERLGMTAAELGDRMGAAELHGWIAYDSVNRSESWHQTAMICREIHWAMGDPREVEDFLPPPMTFAPEAPAPDLPAQLIAWAKARNLQHPPPGEAASP